MDPNASSLWQSARIGAVDGLVRPRRVFDNQLLTLGRKSSGAGGLVHCAMTFWHGDDRVTMQIVESSGQSGPHNSELGIPPAQNTESGDRGQ